MKKSLSKFGNVKLVGKSFGVLTLKIDEYDFDFALPRIEKIGKSHQDFEVITNQNSLLKKQLLEETFTINAIGYDYFKDKFLDPFDGIKDLKDKKIKHINDKTFCEDSLKFIEQFNLLLDLILKLQKKQKELCKQIVLSDELYIYLKREFWRV